MKILIDMNLSPAWVSVLEEAGHTASHWSTIGSFNAPDREVLLWAKANGCLLFTHDLDFGAILAATGPRTTGPDNRDVGSKTTYGMPIIVCRSFVQNRVTGANSSSLISRTISIASDTFILSSLCIILRHIGRQQAGSLTDWKLLHVLEFPPDGP